MRRTLRWSIWDSPGTASTGVEGPSRSRGPSVALDAGIGIGVREGDDALRDAFDEAIQAMKVDGSLNALIERWFGPSAQQH